MSSATQTDPSTPTRDLRPSPPAHGAPAWRSTRPRWAVELALVAVLYAAYDTTRGLRHGGIATADASGMRILRWERALHLSPEHFLNQVLWHVPVLAVLASYDYAALHFIVTPAVLIWLYRRHPDHYASARTALVVATVTALVIYWLLPTTPPRLLPGGEFHDILASVHQWGWWSSEGSAPRGLGGLTNQLAAMPSLHVGWALWSGWLIARHARRRVVRILGAAYPVVTALVVMGTGNHYFFDAIGGVAVVAFGAGVARLASGRRALPALGADVLVSAVRALLHGENSGRAEGRRMGADRIEVDRIDDARPADGGSVDGMIGQADQTPVAAPVHRSQPGRPLQRRPGPQRVRAARCRARQAASAATGPPRP